MKKSTSLPLIISLAAIAVSLLAYVFLHTPSSRPAALAEIKSANIEPQGVTDKPAQTWFYDFDSWPTSNKLKPNQHMMQVLEMMTPVRPDPKKYFLTATQYLDFNGDNLVDILYFDYSFSNYGRNGTKNYLVLRNKGDYQFERVYKCQWSFVDNNNKINTFYGDCAAKEPPYEDEFYSCTTGSESCYFFQSAKYLKSTFFHDYRGWAYSSIAKDDDLMRRSLNLMTISKDPINPLNDNYERASQFIDLNSDGLVDVLFAQTEFGLTRPESSNFYNVDEYAVLINKGDFTKMDIEYKCYSLSSGHVYGDCAAL